MPDRDRRAGASDGPDPEDETPHGPGEAAEEAFDGLDDADEQTIEERTGADAERSAPELPEDVVEEAERLTRLARRASDDAEATAYREERATLLAEHDYAPRLREDDDGEVLVCHPAEWLVDDAPAGGSIDPANIDDVDRAVEIPLEGSDDPDDWETVYEQNEAVAAAVREAHGDVHGENAAELAEYASNHYAKPLAALTAAELAHFREDYYTRNVWPSDEQAAALERSLELVYEELSVPLPDD